MVGMMLRDGWEMRNMLLGRVGWVGSRNGLWI